MHLIFRFLLIVWQLPQFVAGEAVYFWHRLFLRGRRLKGGWACCDDYGYARSEIAMYKSREQGVVKGFCLGRRVFVYCDSEYHDRARLESVVDGVVRHEYGHSVQSVWLGPFYLVFGLFSLLVTGVSPGLAGRMWFERGADGIVRGRSVGIGYK